MRNLLYVATLDGSIEQNLSAQGISSSICGALRKSFGLVARVVDGEEIACNIVDKIFVGQTYRITLLDVPTREIPTADIPLSIIYEDEDLAVINKQKGLAVIASHGHYGRSLENALAAKWGQFVYRPVNRLDRDTSGLMIVAKNQLAHSFLSLAHIKRRYIGLCEGEWLGSGSIELPIGKIEGVSMQRIIDPNGQYAKTDFFAIDTYKSCNDIVSIMCFELHTGRTHQIRVHCQNAGHSLCADKLYNPNEKIVFDPNGNVIKEQALHSAYLSFEHPISKEKKEFVSMPACLENTLFEKNAKNLLLTKTLL